ncbi:Low affinity inorganic phosphate transporter 1 [Linum grandiflorum]
MAKVLQQEIEPEEDKIEQIGGEEFSSSVAAADYGLFSKEFLRRHGLHLLGTSSTWFLLDIAFYSQNLFQKDIFSAIGWIPPAQTMNAIEEVFRIARAQTLIALCSTVPGYWFTDHWTHRENRIGFVVMYSLTFFFANFGPNATTFVVPAEIFPARVSGGDWGEEFAVGFGSGELSGDGVYFLGARI